MPEPLTHDTPERSQPAPPRQPERKALYDEAQMLLHDARHAGVTGLIILLIPPNAMHVEGDVHPAPAMHVFEHAATDADRAELHETVRAYLQGVQHVRT